MKLTAAVSLSIASLLGACYGAAPPRPVHVQLPELSPDAELLVHSESKTTMENVQKQSSTCPQGKGEGDPSCVVTHYDVVEPITRTTTRATYGDTPVTYAQFKVITDPKWDGKLDELQHLSHLCTRANVPRYVGMGLALGGVVAMVASGNKGPLGIAGWAGLAAGGVSYGVGYFAYGGRKCNEARALYNQLDLSAALAWDSVQGAEYATEMKTLAEQFNATHGHSALNMRSRHER